MNYISTEKFPDETNFQKLKVLLFLKIKSFTNFHAVFKQFGAEHPPPMPA